MVNVHIAWINWGVYPAGHQGGIGKPCKGPMGGGGGIT